MRKIIATLTVLLILCTSCTSKNSVDKTTALPLNSSVENKTETKDQTSPEQEELKLVGTTSELYANSEEKMINMLNEPDQKRLQKAIQIVSNKIAETVDLYTEEDDIDYDKWNAAYYKKVNGLTFTGITLLAEQILKEIKTKNILHLQEEITDLKNNPTENQEESMSFLQEELEKAQQLSITLDTYVYSEECFL